MSQAQQALPAAASPIAAVKSGGVSSFPRASTTQLVKPLFTGANDTELAQVISELPWLERFTFGAGVDAITGSGSGSAVKPFTVKETGAKSSAESYYFIQTDSELEREIETSASGKYNVSGVKVSGSTSYLNKLKVSELAITLVAKYEESFQGYDQADDYAFTDAAKEYLNKHTPAEFRKSYGDYFVAGAHSGSRFFATYSCESTSEKSMQEFKASLGAETPDVFSADGSARFMQATSKNNIKTEVDVFMEGYKGSCPIGAPWTPEKVIQALAWFKANTDRGHLKAMLKHYSTIDPNYPRMIDVAPAVFVDLRLLYTAVWEIRTLYDSAPDYYQQQMKKEFTALDTGVDANQPVLATDATLRQQYQKDADALKSSLNDVFDRMAFYFLVKAAVSTEPNQGAWIEEGNGQQVWLYGFSKYTKSDAVVISSIELQHKDVWHVGHRDYNFEFGPDEKNLIVGWELISNWNDGTNGYWAKNLPQILLTNHASVHIESRYDRGFDWSFKAFYVEAKDYQF